MLGANLGLLLYGEVSVMTIIICSFSCTHFRFFIAFDKRETQQFDISMYVELPAKSLVGTVGT